LLCETQGCFHHERFDLHLSWTPSDIVFRSSATDARPDRAQCVALLRRVIAAASLPQPSSRSRSTNVYQCTLTWSATTTDHIELRGELRWSTSALEPDHLRPAFALKAPEKWPAALHFPAEPAHRLISIARAPLQPEAPPRRFVAAVLELDTRDQQATVDTLEALFDEKDLPFVHGARVLEGPTAEGWTRLRMQFDAGDLLTTPEAAPLEEDPALHAMERTIADTLGDLAVVRSVRYREVPA
jgi:hypothetical protein